MRKPLFHSGEATKAKALAELAFCNPFLPRRIDLERQILGAGVVGRFAVIHRRSGRTLEETFPHLPQLGEEARKLVTMARKRLVEGRQASDRELRLYQDLVFYWLYNKHVVKFDLTGLSDRQMIARHWDGFLEDFRFFLKLPGQHFERADDPAHVLACCAQIWRAFRNIFNCLIGASKPVTKLRAAIWESTFTHDLLRYGRTLFATLANIPTLITGPSGSGKELVAKAVAHSRYVPFNPQTRCFEQETPSLHSVNLAALSPTLVESELFGHVKGSFTGAVRDRKGWLETCDKLGAVFLDEIGELPPGIQVKLLRVIQERRFQRLGETEDRQFHAKIIAATHRDLALEMRQGRFREDLYYRLCGDIVTTPSLREQLDDSPDDLENMVRFIVTEQLLFKLEEDRKGVTDEVVAFINKKLPQDYPWPGNFRELEQCVRNILIRGEYNSPAERKELAAQPGMELLANRLLACHLSSEDLLRHYYTLVYQKTGSYKTAAEILEVDWRTVRDKVDSDLLRAFRSDAQAE